MSDADDLYLVEPKAFVAARAELAKQLKASGDKVEAARVAKLRRPSPPAWAMNVVAREQPDLVDAALTAGAELRAATEAAVGGDAGELRAATAAERRATDALVDQAAGRLGPKGAEAKQRLAAMVRAAVLDEDVAGDLRRGVLVDVPEPADAGFGFGFAIDVEPGATSSTKQADAEAKREKEQQERAARLAKLEADAERLDRDATAAEERAEAARARADEATRAVEEARDAD